jgi:hypothetical protein
MIKFTVTDSYGVDTYSKEVYIRHLQERPFCQAYVFDLKTDGILTFSAGFYGFATPGEGVAACQLATSLP